MTGRPPRFRRRLRSAWWLIALVAILLLRLSLEFLAPASAPTVDEGIYAVERVVDGDTLLLANGLRLRLQGIDTPETVRPDHPVEAWGHEAHQYTQQFIDQAGGHVRLTFSNERLDAYGRHLAFVWHGDRLLNEELVREGLARARLGYRYSGTMKRRLAAAEREAQQADRGIWSSAINAARADD